MIFETRYQNSLCRRGWLHKYATIKYTDKGELVRCERCGMKLHLRNDWPRHIQASYLIRSIIQESDPLFPREFPEAIKNN
jgi:NMD protein affecting ribosome stability and mRNA decay